MIPFKLNFPDSLKNAPALEFKVISLNEKEARAWIFTDMEIWLHKSPLSPAEEFRYQRDARKFYVPEESLRCNPKLILGIRQALFSFSQERFEQLITEELERYKRKYGTIRNPEFNPHKYIF